MEEGRISSIQLMRLVMSFVIATGLIFRPAGLYDSWLALLFGLGAGSFLPYPIRPFAFVSGQTLIQIHEAVFRPFLGKLFSVAIL